MSDWTVTDDWDRPIPVTEAEIAVFEMYFGDVFDAFFLSEEGKLSGKEKRACRKGRRGWP